MSNTGNTIIYQPQPKPKPISFNISGVYREDNNELKYEINAIKINNGDNINNDNNGNPINIMKDTDSDTIKSINNNINKKVKHIFYEKQINNLNNETSGPKIALGGKKQNKLVNKKTQKRNFRKLNKTKSRLYK